MCWVQAQVPRLLETGNAGKPGNMQLNCTSENHFLPSACQSLAAVIHSHNLILLKYHSSPTFRNCTTIYLSEGCKLKGKQKVCLAWLVGKRCSLPSHKAWECLGANPPCLFQKLQKHSVYFSAAENVASLFNRDTACGEKRQTSR